MNYWKEGIFSEIEEVKSDTNDSKKSFIISYLNGTKSGFEQHDIEINLLKDGDISFYDLDKCESFYIYKEQVKHIIEVLNKYYEIDKENKDDRK